MAGPGPIELTGLEVPRARMFEAGEAPTVPEPACGEHSFVASHILVQTASCADEAEQAAKVAALRHECPSLVLVALLLAAVREAKLGVARLEHFGGLLNQSADWS